MSNEKQELETEMPVRECLVRAACAMLAFCTAIFTLGGVVIVGVIVETSPVAAGLNFGGYVFVGLAALSACFGMTPMAQWINRGLLHSLMGREPLPPKP